MVSSKKSSKTSSFSNSLRSLIKSIVPKSFRNYNKCVKKHCSLERNAYNENKHKIEEKMKDCFLKHSTNKNSLRKCVLSVRKSLPEASRMAKCARTHCKKERNSLMKDVKKKSKVLRKTMHSKLQKSSKLSRK